jgi:hypothetical protein
MKRGKDEKTSFLEMRLFSEGRFSGAIISTFTKIKITARKGGKNDERKNIGLFRIDFGFAFLGSR